MRKVADQPLWVKDSIHHHFPKLDKDIEVDVLIIGGGVTGALSAYIFNEKEIDVAVIERGEIGSESTLASTSILHYEIDTDLKKLCSYLDEVQAIDAFRFTLEAVYKLEDIVNHLEDDCEFIRRPSFYYTNNKDQIDYMNAEYGMRKENGFEVEYIDEETNDNRFTFPFCSGILSYNSGAEVNPVKLTNALFKYCRNEVIPIYENTEAFELDIKDNEIIVTTKDQKKVICKKILMACGYDSLLFFDKPFYTMTRTFSLATKPVETFEGWHGRSLIKNTEDPYIYLRTTKDNRIIIGGEDVDVKFNEEDTLNIKDNHPLAIYKYQLLEKKLNHMFPLIKNKEVEYRFNGLFIDSNDGLPYIDEHEEFPNIYFNIGIGSNGLLYGLMGAMLLSDKHIGIDNKRLELFKFTR